MRLFIAVDLTGPAKDHLGRAIEIGRVLSRESRWLRSDQLHVTLVFLGSVDETGVVGILGTMEAVARRHHPMAISLGAGDVFGSPARPHVLFAKLGNETEALIELQADLTRALGALAPKEDRAFTPHVTVARGRHRRGDPGLARARSAVTPSPSGFIVREMVLYRSETRPAGATYVPLGAAPFAPIP